MRFPFWSSYLSEIVKGRFVVLFLPFTPFFFNSYVHVFLGGVARMRKSGYSVFGFFFSLFGNGGGFGTFRKGYRLS